MEANKLREVDRVLDVLVKESHYILIDQITHELLDRVFDRLVGALLRRVFDGSVDGEEKC